MRQKMNIGTGSAGAPPLSHRCFALFLPALCLALFASGPAHAGELGGGLDARMLLTLGITLGMIAFSIGSAIACLRATQGARRARDAAVLEAEHYRASESMLHTILAGEEQVLLTWTQSDGARLHVSNLPPASGVPNDASELLRFHDWLEPASADALVDAMQRLAERGEAFRLVLRTRGQRALEANGRIAGNAVALKIRAGVEVGSWRKLELSPVGEHERKLGAGIDALRALLTANSGEEEQEAAHSQSEPGPLGGRTRPSVESRFRSFDRLATAFAVFDAGQRLSHFNQAYVDLWQLDPASLAQHPRDGEILDRLRQARRLPERADYRDWKRSWLSAYGSNTQREDQWHLPDGRTLHVIADSAQDGGVTYLYENVTERIQLESRYNALIHVQRETLDTLREGVAVFAPNGRLRLHNRAFASIWRLSLSDLAGEPHIDAIIASCRPFYDVPEDWERTKAAVTAIVSERRSFEAQFDRPDGSVVACAALPLPDGGTLLTYSDITDSKRVERALIERNDALEAADRLKTAFVRNVSYELRTPLTNIIGFTELLAGPMSNSLRGKQGEYLEDIRSSGQTLLAIIDGILDLATIDAGAFELKLARVKVRPVIEAAAQSLQGRLQQGELKLELDIQRRVDTFVADGARVTQILYNLLANAIAFSPRGGRIRLSCRRDRTMLAFEIEDQGRGIPEEYQTIVFERFESRSNGSGHRGPGLGLAIVKSLAELHGGTVTLVSKAGEGTKVTVRLPIEQATGKAAPETQRPESRRAG
jgi:signal transduction histidine kinase